MGKLKVYKAANLSHPDEMQFSLKDDCDLGDELRVHPWRRPGDKAVFLSIDHGYGGGYTIIVSRKKFVQGLLATFDELQLKEENK